MVAEVSDLLGATHAQADKIRCLEAQLKKSENNCARAELACREKVRSNQEFMDQCLAGQMETDQQVTLATEEARTLRGRLVSTQELMRQAEQKAGDAELSYSCRIKDLEKHVLSIVPLSKEA